jgi:hypothetical protein
MALTCARCGAQNPDGNQFCQACGTPLTAAAAGAPPPPPPPAAGPPVQLAYASPPPVPVGYASPYYSPVGAAPQARVHRTPWVLIISAVVALIVLMAGCGTAIALLGGGKFNVSGGISGLPSPTPGTSPSPIASPTLPPGATSVSNDGVTVPLPTGWSVASKDAQSIALLNPAGNGSMVVASGTLNPRQTAQQGKDAVDKTFAGKYPDTKNGPGSTTKTGSVSGVSGISWTLCYTVVASGRSFPAASALFVGVNANGSVGYVLELATLQSNLQAFLTESAPVVQGIQWKLK